MRAREILDENYAGNLRSDLENLLIASKAAGNTEVNTGEVINLLRKSGYAISDYSALSSMLDSSTVVSGASDETISLISPESNTTVDDGEDSADRVASMAQKATKIS